MTAARFPAGAVAHATRHLLRTLARLMAWFWGIAVLVVLLVSAILALAGRTEISVVSFARQAGIWFPFSMHIVVATAYVRVHVAAGMTRRSFVWAALAAAVAVGVGNGLVMATALWFERQVHGWLGWGWVLQDAALDPSGGHWPLMLRDYGVSYLVANLCGLLVGIVYYAAGGWWGTLTLPLTVGPIFVVLGLVAGVEGPWPDRATAYLIPTPGSATAIGLGLAALGAVAFALVARRTAIARART